MMTETVLIIAAHPDDEVLGCGGTIARHVDQGDSVFIIFLADGEGARDDSEHLKKTRKNNSVSALSCLGVKEKDVVFCDFPDNQMDSVPLLTITKVIEEFARKVKPSLVYTHHNGDLNIDHVITHRAVMTAFRPLPNQSVKAIYGFEILSSTGWSTTTAENAFIPQHYVDINSFWNKKCQALEKYQSEIRAFPHARSLEAAQALAVHRGSIIGLEKAEAFIVLRQIID